VAICVLILVTTFTAGKMIIVFGYMASIATPIYAGIFLATDALHEYYGPEDAKKGVMLGFFCMLIAIILGQLVVAFPALETDVVGQGLNSVLGFLPMLFLGSSLAYLVSQRLDVYLFGWVKRKFPKHLFIRNNISTIISQLVDSIIVYTVAFYMVPNQLELIMTAWIFKMVVAFCDTPFLYSIAYVLDQKNTQAEAKQLNQKGQESEII
jgi:uncharacterized integral membrane protein (TIGR00697 family)